MMLEDGGDYSSALRDVFDQFDVDKKGLLGAAALEELCRGLELEGYTLVLLHSLLKDDPQKKVTFDEFKEAFIIILHDADKDRDDEGKPSSSEPSCQPEKLPDSKDEVNASTAGLKMEEDELSTVLQTMQVGKDGYLDIEDLTVICSYIDINMNARDIQRLFIKLDTDHNGKISIQELKSSLKESTHLPSPIPSPPRGRHRSNELHMRRRSLSSTRNYRLSLTPEHPPNPVVLSSGDVTGFFSQIDSRQTGYASADEVVDLWLTFGIENGTEVLHALDFNTNASIHLSDLSMALEESLSTERLQPVSQVALVTSQQELRHLRTMVDGLSVERTKLRQDVHDANVRTAVLTSDADEQYAIIEKTNSDKLMTIESKYQRELKRMQRERQSDMETHAGQISRLTNNLGLKETEYSHKLAATQKEVEAQKQKAHQTSQLLVEVKERNEELMRHKENLHAKLNEYKSQGLEKQLQISTNNMIKLGDTIQVLQRKCDILEVERDDYKYQLSSMNQHVVDDEVVQQTVIDDHIVQQTTNDKDVSQTLRQRSSSISKIPVLTEELSLSRKSSSVGSNSHTKLNTAESLQTKSSLDEKSISGQYEELKYYFNTLLNEHKELCDVEHHRAMDHVQQKEQTLLEDIATHEQEVVKVVEDHRRRNDRIQQKEKILLANITIHEMKVDEFENEQIRAVNKIQQNEESLLEKIATHEREVLEVEKEHRRTMDHIQEKEQTCLEKTAFLERADVEVEEVYRKAMTQIQDDEQKLIENIAIHEREILEAEEEHRREMDHILEAEQTLLEKSENHERVVLAFESTCHELMDEIDLQKVAIIKLQERNRVEASEIFETRKESERQLQERWQELEQRDKELQENDRTIETQKQKAKNKLDMEITDFQIKIEQEKRQLTNMKTEHLNNVEFKRKEFQELEYKMDERKNKFESYKNTELQRFVADRQQVEDQLRELQSEKFKLQQVSESLEVKKSSLERDERMVLEAKLQLQNQTKERDTLMIAQARLESDKIVLLKIRDDIESEKTCLEKVKAGVELERENMQKKGMAVETDIACLQGMMSDMDLKKGNILKLQEDIESEKTVLCEMKADFYLEKRNILKLQEDIESEKLVVYTMRADMELEKGNILKLQKDLESEKTVVYTMRANMDLEKVNIVKLQEDLESEKTVVYTMRADMDLEKVNVVKLQEDIESEKIVLSKMRADMELEKVQEKNDNVYSEKIVLQSESEQGDICVLPTESSLVLKSGHNLERESLQGENIQSDKLMLEKVQVDIEHETEFLNKVQKEKQSMECTLQKLRGNMETERAFLKSIQEEIQFEKSTLQKLRGDMKTERECLTNIKEEIQSEKFKLQKLIGDLESEEMNYKSRILLMEQQLEDGERRYRQELVDQRSENNIRSRRESSKDENLRQKKKDLHLHQRSVSNEILHMTRDLSFAQSEAMKDISNRKDNTNNVVVLEQLTKLQLSIVNQQCLMNKLQILRKKEEDMNQKMLDYLRQENEKYQEHAHSSNLQHKRDITKMYDNLTSKNNLMHKIHLKNCQLNEQLRRATDGLGMAEKRCLRSERKLSMVLSVHGQACRMMHQ